jgi:hypothetical protein
MAPDDYPRRRDLHGVQFTLIEPALPSRTRFSFAGPFEGQETVWDATLLTLEAHHATEPPTDRMQRRSFIEIGPATAAGRVVRIVLDVAAIDEGVILRTIIMMRQYKRLHAGRHEFGEPREFPASR